MPYTERVPPAWVKRRIVSIAVDWLEQRWDGECDLPREIREVLHARQVVELQRGKPLMLAVA